jgi:high-affinity iron transporter
MSEYFSIAALLIMFREALEASVIIAVLLQMLNKMKMQHLKRWVWYGAILGVVISVVLGIIFVLVFYLANTKLMSQNASMIFKGCICWLASILITVVAFAMLKFYNLERKWKRKLESEFSRDKEARNYKWSMFLLAGSATLREGIESVLFLTGTSAGLSVKSVIIPGIVGIVAGSLLGVLVYYSGHSIKSLKWFFILSSALLMFIAAGMVINGTQFFSYAGLFGVMFPYELRPWSNRIVWNATSCCNPNTNQGWALLRALFGWQAAPTNLGVLYWGLYWAVTLPLLGWKAYNGTLTDRLEAGRDDLKSFARHGIQGDFDSFNSNNSLKDGSSKDVSKMLTSSSSDEGDGGSGSRSSHDGTSDVEAGVGDVSDMDAKNTSAVAQDTQDTQVLASASASASASSWWKKTWRRGSSKPSSSS